jgi:hypothetical protein
MFVAAFVVAAVIGCQCGPGSGDPCAAVQCAAGLVCDPDTGKCALPAGGAGGGQGGGAAAADAGSACAQPCSGATPVCNEATGQCVTCTEAAGCGGATPVCQPIANGGLGRCVVCTVDRGCGGDTPACDPTVFPNGACVQCMRAEDCPVPGTLCDLDTHTCVAPGTGGGAGGGAGGGSGGAGGGGNPLGPPEFDDAGVTTRCFPIDAGTRACTNECPTGYQCISGVCELRGKNGPVQVTLRWNTETDLDLYLVEPLPDGGACEIYYGQPGVNPNQPPPPIPIPIPLPQGCGAKGWLDLDANRACGSGDTTVQLTRTPVENIIYSPGVVPTSGEYTVRVNNWSACSVSTPIPWEVEVRANGQTRWYCGTFAPGTANGGGAGAGVVVTKFRLP